MAAKRTDEEIMARLRELLTQQEDLEEQLSTLTEHLRSGVDALAEPEQEPTGLRSIELDHVLELLGRLAVSPTESDATEVIVDSARHMLPGTHGALCLATGTAGEDEELAVVAVWDVEEQWNRPYGGALTGGSPPQRLANHAAAGPTGQARTYPLRGFGLRLGELRIWPDPVPERLPDEELDGRGELLARCAGLVLGGMMLQRRLRRQSVRDPLTGLFNVRYLLDTIEREVSAAQRDRKPCSLIMLDIDQFSTFNDRYGHELGDRMLAAIAGLFGERFRASDACCRYSGERFAVLLPGSDRAGAMERAERLRADIAELTLDGDDGPTEPVTVSCGVATFPDHAEGPVELLAAAESGVQIARRDGGNAACEPPLK